jgi:hypothetical protein
MAGTGAKLWATGDTVTATAFQTYLQDQIVAVFDDSSTRDAAYGGAGEPTLAEGMVCYLEDSNIFQIYSGSAWVSVFDLDLFDTSKIELNKDSGSSYVQVTSAHDTEATSPKVVMRKSDGSTASPAAVDDDASLGTIEFYGYDGNSWALGAKIEALVDGTPGDGDIPTEILFSTSADGSEAPTARMTIQPDGKVGIGADMTPARLFQVTVADSGVTPATDHHVLIENSGDMGLLIGSGNTSNGYIRFGDDGSSSAGGFNYDHDINKLWIRVNGTDKMNIDNSGIIRSPRSYSATTSNSANLWVDTDGGFYRSTSSGKYKKDVETMEDTYADAILALRPVWFRSTATADKEEWSHWGFIAEEVAAVDPRLVYYGPQQETDAEGNDLFEEDANGASIPVYKKDENGKVIQEPQGVQYDRLVPHLLNIIQRLDERVKTLEGS